MNPRAFFGLARIMDAYLQSSSKIGVFICKSAYAALQSNEPILMPESPLKGAK
jgi:hypothetical protein